MAFELQTWHSESVLIFLLAFLSLSFSFICFGLIVLAICGNNVKSFACVGKGGDWITLFSCCNFPHVLIFCLLCMFSFFVYVDFLLFSLNM